MNNVKSIFEKISGFATPFFGVSWHPKSAEGIKRKLLLLDRITETYLSVESGIWRAKGHFQKTCLPKDEVVAYLRPLTSKAAETRDYIRAHQFEWGPLDSFIDGLSVQILLCFAQLLTFQVAKGDDVDREMHQPSELDKNIYEIREKLKALSYILHLYHAVLNNGESSLDKDDLDTFQWLNAVSVPRT